MTVGLGSLIDSLWRHVWLLVQGQYGSLYIVDLRACSWVGRERLQRLMAVVVLVSRTRRTRWESRSEWSLWMIWSWAQCREVHSGLSSQRIWDPRGVLGIFLIDCVIRLISGIPCLCAGRLLISTFYKRSQYNIDVSTTIACLANNVTCAGTNIVLIGLPTSCMPGLQILMVWSPNLKVMAMVSLLVIILKRLGIYLQFSVSFSISDSEQYFIVHEQPVGVVHLLVCSSLALASSRMWLVSAPNVFRDAILNDCNR
ncbi:hypothetical protein RchiOBHm_Chr5g0032021 [Rosa chinensis]|uniref:Uncharacterized protein n=1 Tax=Rosa chinensis TaxID=74649 RepID=A0A2P6QAB5_ROSCH|nr:hypothetical protein RchiOBHm_Chr5g0032021 [Rosa chinensis]